MFRLAILLSLVCSTALAQCPGGNCPLTRVRTRQVIRGPVQQQVIPTPVVRQVVQPVVQPVAVASVATCPCGDVCPCLNVTSTPPNLSVKLVTQAPVTYQSSYSYSTRTTAGYPTPAPVVYPTKQPYVRQTSGPTWNYYGSNLAAHLSQEHGVDPTGMSYQEMVAAHSDAHNGAIGFSNNTVARSRSVTRVGSGPIRRLFGR